MFPEPRRVDTYRVPTELFIRRSATDPRWFDVVDEAGAVLARDVPNLNTARVLAAAPRLLDGFYEMRWMLNITQAAGQDCSLTPNAEDEAQQRIADWLADMEQIEADACSPEGRFPL